MSELIRRVFHGPRDLPAELRALGAGQCHRAGIDPTKPACSPPRSKAEMAQAEADAESGWDARHYTMLDVCREVCKQLGLDTSASFPEQVRAAVSTGALSSIFTTSVNAQLLATYNDAPDSTDWCSVVDVKNFQTQERTRLELSGGMPRLPRGAAAKDATISDAIESYKVYRYSERFSVDEQDVIDDNMSALLTMAKQLGMKARQIRPDLVYSLLLANANMRDANPLFDASNHANLGTTGTALSATTLQTAVAAMSKQRENGRTLNIRPAFLIVPQDLFFAAEIILTSAARVIAVASDGTLNPLRGMMQVRSDDRIGVAGVTDPVTDTAYAGSATNWFLAAAPNSAPTVEVGYIQATGRVPVVEPTTKIDAEYGLGWHVKLDIGAKALDWRGLYRATGEA